MKKIGGLKMRKTVILATTTLSGALLFGGVGATHEAHAAENQSTTNET